MSTKCGIWNPPPATCLKLVTTSDLHRSHRSLTLTLTTVTPSPIFTSSSAQSPWVPPKAVWQLFFCFDPGQGGGAVGKVSVDINLLWVFYKKYLIHTNWFNLGNITYHLQRYISYMWIYILVLRDTLHDVSWGNLTFLWRNLFLISSGCLAPRIFKNWFSLPTLNVLGLNNCRFCATSTSIYIMNLNKI